MSTLKQYSWEGTLAGIIAGAIMLFTVVTHLTADPGRPSITPAGATAQFGPPAFHPTPDRTAANSNMPATQPWATRKAAGASRAARHPPKPADPLEVVLGPSSISGQFRLLTLSRTPLTPTSDKLTLGIRITSRAMADLVTPFQSEMLQVRSHALQPINPEHSFSYRVSAGNTRDEDIAFIIPADLDLDHTVLRVLFYNELKEIPLKLAPRDSQH